MRAYGVLRRIITTTRTGLPEHILKVFSDVIVPLSKEKPEGFLYEELVERHNQVFPEDYKSSKTLYKYVSELRAIGYVDTKPDPEIKRRNLIYVLKNPPDPLSYLGRTLARSFSLEKLKKWWKSLREQFPPDTDLQLTLFGELISLEDLYQKCYRIWTSGETYQKRVKKSQTSPIQEKKQVNILPKRGRILAGSVPQQAEKLTTGDLLQELRSRWSRGTLNEFDNLVMQLRRCDDEEAERLRERWLDEGLLAYDPEGYLVWVT